MSPDGGEDGEFFLSRTMLEKLEKNGPTWKFDDASFIPEILSAPAVVFQGLKREGFQNGYCYSGVPERNWDDPDPENVPRIGMVFVIYIKPAWGLVVFDWDWRSED